MSRLIPSLLYNYSCLNGCRCGDMQDQQCLRVNLTKQKIQPSRQDQMFAATTDTFWFLLVIGCVPYWHYYKACRITFTLKVYYLTVMSGCDGEKVTAVRVSISVWNQLTNPPDEGPEICKCSSLVWGDKSQILFDRKSVDLSVVKQPKHDVFLTII